MRRVRHPAARTGGHSGVYARYASGGRRCHPLRSDLRPRVRAGTMTSSGDVLLTGATGFVGMELLARYLERGDRDIFTLVRADSPEGAQARVDAVLQNLFGARAAEYGPRVHAVAADMTAPGL